TIVVDPNGDIAAANALAKAGDTIEIAAGTFVLAEQIAIKDGVTYRGAGPGLTIIDGNNVTQAFVAWGDRGATNGQVDANGVGVQNTTGPKDWVVEGMTIQNCVADTKDRQDILSAARDLLNNYKGIPYTLAAAQTENGGVADNPGWFDILSGSADEDLTDMELAAYLDANPPGSAGHLVANDNLAGDGGAITIENGAVGTIQNCEFLNNHTPAEGAGDDGGALNITGLSVITINDCLFDGNYAVSPDSVAITDSDGDGGHIKIQGNSASALTPGTTLIANGCIFLNGNASDDGGAIQTAAVGSIVRLDACWFEGNTAWDNGSVMSISTEGSGELTVTNCVFANNITKADNGPDRMCEVRRNSKFVNCTFLGNNQNDEDLIYNNADVADADGDGVDDETADTTQVINCIFVNNIIGNSDDIMGSRNTEFTVAATNCLFFGNTQQNGNAADNTQRPEVEVGSVNADPLLDAAYVPGAGSPAIDAGVDPATLGVVVTTDYSGNARPQGAGYDIGAYEFVVAPPPPAN
ncbi:MAG TPA: choice-of-anchor Q domain-containing protein, partial [Sedimentisphaerales bacterium]|nr:choice-of-anchor Q domain-containing protein [Sedimentisphaerales bacterium]